MRRMSLVGIDIGSSAVKVAAYDTGGALLAQATEAVPSLHPGPGLSEVGGDGVWKGVVAVVQQVTAGTWESVVAPLSRPRPREVAMARLALTRQPSTPGWGLWARSPNGTSVLDWALGVSGIRLSRLEAALGSAGPDPSPALMIPHLSGAPGPWPDSPGSAGAVSGLTLATTGADLSGPRWRATRSTWCSRSRRSGPAAARSRPAP
jgi:sugar (pentulose or hexulose) kinase